MIFNELSLTLHSDEIIALIGPSGCGKSTLLRMISGLESVDEGAIEFQNPEQSTVGYVFQKPILYPHLTVEGNAALGISEKLSKAERSQRIAHELQQVGLEGFAQRKPDSLSGGEAQRVTVVRALLNQPDVLLLDEPFSALDLPTRRKIAKDTRAFLKSKHTAAIHVTHDPEEASILADRVIEWSHLMPDVSDKE
ncbi:MAG: ABC transporter substrate-binding protein [Euryarchaeota archaeon]|nr:ABC transporter substrate-binding protein [Euryarchaeota archaeon]|tara:strand:- start:29942 stop:30526 length:585 start_codon:yes stop_codon:yes gene_type:complete